MKKDLEHAEQEFAAAERKVGELRRRLTRSSTAKSRSHLLRGRNRPAHSEVEIGLYRHEEHATQSEQATSVLAAVPSYA